jgi:hypothetical protein
MRGGVERGICLNYWRLSYRRKFIRAAWMAAVILTVLVAFQVTGELDDYLGSVNKRPMEGKGWRIVGIVAALIAFQLAYTFLRWRSERNRDGD